MLQLRQQHGLLVTGLAAEEPNHLLCKGLRIATELSTLHVAHHLPTDICQSDPDLAAVVAA
jgi:hypothetical protein